MLRFEPQATGEFREREHGRHFTYRLTTDDWAVCWLTGRVDWHNTLADARDNALKGL